MSKTILLLLPFYSLIFGQENLLQPFPKIISDVSGSVLLLPQIKAESSSNDTVEKKAAEYFNFKEVELNIRRTIGERKLWFEGDSLWQQIRKVRYITDKNPFYYHLNYSRMKALRLQLKTSVPEPTEKNVFVEKVNELFYERTEVLSEIKSKNESSYNRLRLLAVPKPDFNQIQ